MSDAFYEEVRDDIIIPLITEFGKEYVINSPRGFSKETLSSTPVAPRRAVGIVKNNQFVRRVVDQVDSQLQTVTGRSLILLPEANAKPIDTVIVDGIEHSMKNVIEIKPANIVLLYVLELEK